MRQNNYAEMISLEQTDGKSINSASFDSVAGFEPLLKALYECKKGVSWKTTPAYFSLNAIEETLKLEKDIANGKYKAKKPSIFKQTYPKPRDIQSIHFRDRIFQRSLNDNALSPIITRKFIRDNSACQKGRGTDDGRARLVCFLERYYRRYGSEGYVLQCDMKSYYPTMSHKAVRDLFFQMIKGWAFQQSMIILDDPDMGPIGYYAGSPMVQLAGVALLNNLDHFAKEELGVAYYHRYMDDFFIIHHDREFLRHCFSRLLDCLEGTECKFNKKKTRTYPLREGILFLGFNHKLTKTGKVIISIDPKVVKRAYKRYSRMVEKSKRGEIPREKVDACMLAFKSHMEKGASRELLHRFETFYQNLWR